MEPFIGQIQPVGFNFAPRGWALCDGALLSISQFSALFSLLGTTYGGDGRTTFALPDLRGRVAVHVGNGPGLTPVSWGQRGGSNTNTLVLNNLPNIPVNVSSADATQGAATPGASIATPGMASGRTFVPGLGFNTSSPNTALNAGTAGGSSSAVNNMQPFLGIYWCIALQGVFPSRN